MYESTWESKKYLFSSNSKIKEENETHQFFVAERRPGGVGETGLRSFGGHGLN